MNEGIYRYLPGKCALTTSYDDLYVNDLSHRQQQAVCIKINLEENRSETSYKSQSTPKVDCTLDKVQSSNEATILDLMF